MSHKMQSVSRRAFLGESVYGTLGLALGLSGLSYSKSANEAMLFQADKPQSTIVLVRDETAVDEEHVVNPETVASMLDRALCALTGEKKAVQAWAKFITPEDQVGIKLTKCSWMRIHTEQALLDAINARCKDLKLDAKQIHAHDYGMPLDQVTALINVPSVKVHTLTGIAAAIKNYINFTGKESSYHLEGSAKLGEAWQLPNVKGKTRLIITDLLRPYFGPGPQINPVHRWDYKGLLVGTDPVAMDTVALAICQTKRDLFKGEPWPVTPPAKSITEADHTYKLGTIDPAKIKVVKMGWEKDILI